MKKRNVLSKMIIVLIVIAVSIRVSGQENHADYQYKFFQFTFLTPPFSTNGANNANCINDFSLNPFIGVSGGAGVLEIGGFINIDRYTVSGVQIAGFGNTVGDFANGVQVAGFYNINGTDIDGVQSAGFMNIAGRDVTGVQCAGFMNTSGGKLKGVQAAGFLNISGEALLSVQAAGFGNISGTGNSNVQAAGFFNVANNVEGVQVAGFINIANRVKGLQLAGFINICDSIDGLPIAFINIVRQNGYRGFEISSNEIQLASLSYRMGIDRLYTIYSFGKPYGDRTRWMYGLGLGTELALSEQLLFNLEGTVHQELWIANDKAPRMLYTDRLNLYSTVRFIAGWKTKTGVSFHLGPTINIGVCGDNSESPVSIRKLIGPYSLLKYTRASTNTTTQFWFGLHGGIRF